MQTAELEITGAAHGGDGVGRLDGLVCFVAGALPGDTVRARVVRRAKRALWATIEEVVAPSPDREAGRTPHSGADAWVHFRYPAQAAWKQRIVCETLRRVGGIEVDLGWREDAALRNGYRTRAEFHGDGQHFGFFARGTHRVVDTESCALCHPRLNDALARLRPLGLKGSVTVTVDPEDEAQLVWTKFTKRTLKQAFPGADTPQDTGARSAFVFDGVPVVNGCFSQPSLLLNRLLLDEVRTQAGQPGTVLDCYAGSGNLSLGLAGAGAQVRGYDHNPVAAAAAAEHSGHDYRAGDETDMAAALREQPWDLVLLDPPRTGAKHLAQDLAHAEAGAIVYVSCDPATLARDLKTLCAAGWQVERATAIDLFPHTPHVETVCRLTPR